MIDNKRGLLTFLFLGRVTEDKPENGWDIYVYPVELVPVYTGDVNTPNKITTVSQDHLGNNFNVRVTEDRRIRCRWIKMFGGANRVTPPSVTVGEIVVVINLGDVDQFYWTDSIFPDSDLRKKENLILWLSNKKQATEQDNLIKGYYFRMDTYKKMIELHSSDNDGEFTPYKFQINTKEGNIKLFDGKKNMYTWDSKNSKYILHTDQQNGEFTTYDIQLNAKEGNYMLKDGKNNYLKFDSQNQQFGIHAEGDTQYDILIDSQNGKIILKDSKGNDLILETSNNTLTINTKNELNVNIENNVNINCKVANVNANNSTTIKSNSVKVECKQAEIQASRAEINANSVRISSSQCQIN